MLKFLVIILRSLHDLDSQSLIFEDPLVLYYAGIKLTLKKTENFVFLCTSTSMIRIALVPFLTNYADRAYKSFFEF